MTNRPTAWAVLIALGVIWGGSFLAVEVALTGAGPLTIAAARIGLAALVLGALAVAGPGLPRSPRIWLHAAGFGLFTNALPFMLLSWAQQSVSSGFAGITMAAVPLMILPLAHLVSLLGEALPAGFLAALGLILAGLAVAQPRAPRTRP